MPSKPSCRKRPPSFFIWINFFQKLSLFAMTTFSLTGSLNWNILLRWIEKNETRLFVFV